MRQDSSWRTISAREDVQRSELVAAWTFRLETGSTHATVFQSSGMGHGGSRTFSSISAGIGARTIMEIEDPELLVARPVGLITGSGARGIWRNLQVSIAETQDACV